LFNREDDCLAVRLRPGNVHSAEDWETVLLPEIKRQQKQGRDVVVRADAAFGKPELYEALEARGVKYVIRIPSNDTLEQAISELLRRPVRRPSHRPPVRYTSFRYQAASWRTARRVVAKIEFRYDELFPRVGFIVTTLETDSRAVVRFYRAPGQIWRVQRVRFPLRQGLATHREPSAYRSSHFGGRMNHPHTITGAAGTWRERACKNTASS